jgi:hypothetical protein
MAATRKATRKTTKATAKEPAACRRPATRKTAASKAPVKPAAPKAARPAGAAPKAHPELTVEERFKMVEFEAYILAEKDGFKQDPAVYWIAAERDICDRLGLRKT